MAELKRPLLFYQIRLFTRLLAIAILVAFVIGFFLPRSYQVERHITLPGQTTEIAEYLHHFEYWPDWLYVHDGTLVPVEFNQASIAAFKIDYYSEKQSSKRGSLIVETIEEQQIIFTVIPVESMKPVRNTLHWFSKDGASHIAWVIEGELEAGLLSPYLALFANRIAGDNFEKSLFALKEQLEVNFQR